MVKYLMGFIYHTSQRLRQSTNKQIVIFNKQRAIFPINREVI